MGDFTQRLFDFVASTAHKIAAMTKSNMAASMASSDISSLEQQAAQLVRELARWNKVYVWALFVALIAGAITFWAQRQSISLSGKLSDVKDEIGRGKDNDLQRDLKAKDEQISKTNERAAKLEKEAADARLELAKIDPLNLPIRSIRADIFLIVRGNFFEWHFENNPVIKGGARSVRVSLCDNEGAIVDLEESSFESFVAATVPDTSNFDGRSFKMSFVWPTADWLTAKGVFKYWIDRTNASASMLDKKMLGMVISLPPTKDAPENLVEITDSLCSITINGSIRRNFSVPKSAPAHNIFCPVKKD